MNPVTELRAQLDAQQERLGHCVHCGFCLPVCPTYIQLGDEADSPRGRLHLMRAVVEGRLDPDSDAFQLHLDRCLGCRACETVCPSGVEYGFLLERARALAVEARRPGLATRLLPAVMARPGIRSVALGLGRVLRATGVPRVLARRLPARGEPGRVALAMGMLATSRSGSLGDVPVGGDSDADSSPRSIRASDDAPDGVRTPDDRLAPGTRGRVALLEGCVQQGLFEHVNHATRLALEVNGWEVVTVPDQGCCGALHAHSGRLDEARELARHNVEAFTRSGVDHVVSNAAGCGALLRESGELLEDDATPSMAHEMGNRVRDISELLAGGDSTPVRGHPLTVRVAYDPPCHLHHAQRVTTAPIRLLEGIPGVELVPLPHAEECCGGAGIYGITHQELGGRVGGRKIDAILGTECEVVATGNPGCQMQIGAGLLARGSRLPVLHPIELLAESYRRAGWS